LLLAEAARRVEALRLRQRDLERAAACAPIPPSFAVALAGETVAVIAEVKRHSPSKGAIRPDIDAVQQARAYADGGAAAVSVLTEPTHFGGSVGDLEAIVAKGRIPTLKKDFHVDRVQLFEARALGASAALLIARALSPADLTLLAGVARDIGLDVLVEIRDEVELDRALGVDAGIIGINNRNLETLDIDANTAMRLLPLIPPSVIAVAESGMQTAADVARVASVGVDAVLVGSSVSAADDPRAAVRALTGIRRTPRRG
jgi:indole-3-glycerol phosphate synthase